MNTKTGSSESAADCGRGGFSFVQWTIPVCGLLPDMWSGIRSEPRRWPGLKTIPGAAPPPIAECSAIPCSLRYRSPGQRQSRSGQRGRPGSMMRRCSQRFGSKPEPSGLPAAKYLFSQFGVYCHESRSFTKAIWFDLPRGRKPFVRIREIIRGFICRR